MVGGVEPLPMKIFAMYISFGLYVVRARDEDHAVATFNEKEVDTCLFGRHGRGVPGPHVTRADFSEIVECDPDGYPAVLADYFA